MLGGVSGVLDSCARSAACHGLVWVVGVVPPSVRCVIRGTPLIVYCVADRSPPCHFGMGPLCQKKILIYLSLFFLDASV